MSERRQLIGLRNMLTELLGALNRDGKDISASPLPPMVLAELVDLIEDGVISGKIGKDVFEACYAGERDPAAYVEAKGLRQISDPGELMGVIAEVLNKNAKQAADYRSGKEGLFGFFVGQVMKATGGRANPQVANDLLLRALKPGGS